MLQPVVLTQIQNIPADLSMTDIPWIALSHLDSSSATITIHSTSTSASQVEYTVGYLFMDSVPNSQCSSGCKTNKLSIEVRTKIRTGHAAP